MFVCLFFTQYKAATHTLPGLLAFCHLSRLLSFGGGKAEGLRLRSTRQGEGTLPPAEGALPSPPPHSVLLRGVQDEVAYAKSCSITIAPAV